MEDRRHNPCVSVSNIASIAPGDTARYLELHKRAQELLMVTAKMSVKTYIFAAITVPKAEKLAKEQKYDEAAKELDLIDQQVSAERQKLGI